MIEIQYWWYMGVQNFAVIPTGCEKAWSYIFIWVAWKSVMALFGWGRGGVQFFNFQHALVHWTSLLAKEMNTIDLFWKGYTEPPWIEEIIECLVEKPLTDKGLNNKKIATFSVTLYCKLKYGITIYLFCFYTLDKSTRK